MLLFPTSFTDYVLLDCGDFEKLERFGAYVIRRPEPKAVWAKSMSEREWAQAAHATFRHAVGSKSSPDERGTWSVRDGMPDRWNVQYDHDGLKMTLRLALTSFKHVGVFPEQASNWDYIYKTCSGGHNLRVLNLFAYTGAASLAARAAGADVVHLDSIKQVVTWANANMQESGLSGIRWLVDDALKYVERQARKRTIFDGIILDPPAYGRGPDGERWLLNEGIYTLLQAVKRILAPASSFMVLNLYAMGFTSVVADTLVRAVFGDVPALQCGELCIEDKFGKRVPLSVVARFDLVQS
jgi:23S rRNA (cytosine1962-C5)-methyltransferase